MARSGHLEALITYRGPEFWDGDVTPVTYTDREGNDDLVERVLAEPHTLTDEDRAILSAFRPDVLDELSTPEGSSYAS